MAHDVTERKSLESRLRQAQKMEAIGTLAGGIAHDFNNILGIIMGFAEMIQDGAPSEGDLSRRVGHIQEACRRARDLVSQILTFSRQEEAQDPRPLHLAPLLKETMKLLRASLPRSIEIREQIQAERDVVLAEPSRVQQILMNLCANAAHAMRESGGLLEVRLELADSPAEIAKPAAAGYLRLLVRDSGHGIAREHLERIFEPFFTTKKPREGTGMGLAVVHGIVERLGGLVRVRSEPGQGATFEVYLPLSDDLAFPGCKNQEAKGLGQGRALFVDDEPELAEVGRAMLESLGCSCLAVSDPFAALGVLQNPGEPLDILITDQSMPGLSGLELARQAAKLRPGLAIIICSGFCEELGRDKVAAAGVRDVLAKPVERAALCAALARHLPKAGQSSQQLFTQETPVVNSH